MPSVNTPEKPWWKTLMGYPEWMNIEDRLWHGWAYGSSLLVVFALLLVVAPKHLVVGPMVAMGLLGLARALRIRNAAARPEA
jgi:heme A synthase